MSYSRHFEDAQNQEYLIKFLTAGTVAILTYALYNVSSSSFETLCQISLYR